jgi:hypothetical protein
MPLRAARLALGTALAAALLAAPAVARADNAAAAEALFVEGRKLLEEKRYDLACPKLAESHRLDPATGTLLALALCREGEGKLASAWAAYIEAGARAHTEKNAEREAAAKERAAGLEPKLPRLVVKLAPGVAAPVGMVLTRDGDPLGQGSLGSSLPVDPGEHVFTAEAPGKKPTTQKITITAGETKEVLLGPFEEAPGIAPPQGSSFFTPMRVAGVAAGAVGLVGLGLAGAFAGIASSRKAESDKDCDGDVCGPVGLPVRQEARSFGDGATAALVAGGVLAAAGVTLVLLGGEGRPATGRRDPGLIGAPRSAGRPRVTASLHAGPAATGVLVRGTF